MDVNNIKVGNDGNGRRSKLLHTSEIVVSSPQIHNGHSSTINLSYQIVLQDHNYGAPLPPSSSETATILADQCKQETISIVSPSATYVPVTSQQPRVGIKTLQPQRQGSAATNPQPVKGGTAKTNGTSNFPVNKRQRTTSGTLQINNCSNGVSLITNHINNSIVSSSPAPRKSYDSPKSSLGSNTGAPPLVLPKSGLSTFPYSAVQGVVGDLNSHLYAAASEKLVIKEEDKPNGGTGGLSNYVNTPKGWFRNKEQTRSRSDLRDSFNDDSNESLSSPHMATETDQEGEETETAPECEGEEDEEDQHEESVTRCICKFGHDDGYMICCDRCSVWQHVECMNLDRNNIPDEYLCELCQPRRVDRARARAVQYRKRQEFRLSTPPPSGREGPVKRSEASSRSKDRYSREPKEEYIDVEKTQTPKKVCRNNSGSTQGPKYGRNSGINSTTASSVPTISSGKNSLRGEGQKVGKRGGQKWKRKLDKQDDSDGKERLPRKRKIMRSKLSSETIDVVGTSVAEGSPMVKGNGSAELLLQWIDHYEEAVTNHYSPELRARVSIVRPNGLFSESLPSSSSPPAYRLASKAGGFKTLVASYPIASGTPVIECRGKYMLSSQLRPYKTGGDSGSSSVCGLRPTPHILFHHLPTSSSDNCSPTPMVEMCVDGRSYGNEARFVWQSCQPNAEVKHTVVKGSLHLYLVARLEILDSEEITIAHDSKNPLPCPYEGCPHMAGNKGNGRTGLTSSTTPHNYAAQDGDRKRRRRRTNSTAATDGPATPVSPPVTGAGTSQSTPAHCTSTSTPSTSLNNSEPAVTAAPATPPAVSAPPPTPVKRQYRTPSKPILPTDEDSADGGSHHYDETDGTGDPDSTSHGKKKLSREERKMEAIMKAFERLEKAEQRRQEALARMAHRKDGKDGKDDECMDADVEHPSSPTPLAINPLQSTDQSHQSDRKDVSSYDSKSRNFRRGIPMRKRGGGVRLRRTSSGAGIGGVCGNGSGSRSRTRALSGEVHSGHSATEGEELELVGSSSSPGHGGHPGALMDESQVLAFKCPKTKKVVFNNWSAEGDLNGGKDASDPSCGSNPLSLSVPMCYMRNPNPRSPTRPIRTAHLRPSTLASLKSPSGSGSPDPHGEGGQSNDENLWAAPLPGSAGGSAKKRWLRQAISEETETDSPNSGQGGGGGMCVAITSVNSTTEVLDHVTPLKKRRLARASLSSETSFTPPSTPTPTLERAVGSNENTNEAMATIQSSTSLLSSTSSSGMDKNESPNLESLSTDSSQTTPPQCEDVDVVEHKMASTSARTNVSTSVSTIPLAKDSLEDQSSTSSVNGFVNDSTQPWSQLGSSIDDVDGNVNVHNQVDEFLPAEAASLLSLRYSISDDNTYASAARPTWEFRAPDAQFMRSRNPNEVSVQSGDASPTDAAQLSPAEGRPRPVKKKLSILEYRQRKQNMNNESNEAPKEEPMNSSSSDSAKPVVTSHKDVEEPASRLSAMTTAQTKIETQDCCASKPNSTSGTNEDFSSSLDGSSTTSSDGDVETSTL